MVEVNNTFYRLLKASTFAKWKEQTPGDFIFVLKMSRFLTHIKRLKDPKDSVDLFLEAASQLGDKIGPLLLQLPPNLKLDLPLLKELLKTFPTDIRITVEFHG